MTVEVKPRLFAAIYCPIKDLSTFSTISGSRNGTINTISGSRNCLFHFYNSLIQKPHHFYNFWILKFFGPYSQFLYPETAVFLQFLDTEIVNMDHKISGSQNCRNGAVSGSRIRSKGQQILNAKRL